MRRLIEGGAYSGAALIRVNTVLELNCRLASAAGPGLRCYLSQMKLGHLCWDSALDLWLLDHFEVGFFASRKGRSETDCDALPFS